jgi:hypothetical protein
MNRTRRGPGRDGFPARLIQDVAAAADVAVGHHVARPVTATTASRRRALTAPRLLPRTVQVCIHCQQNPAGFWVSHAGRQTVRRPWCLACRQQLHPDRYDVIPFDS